MNYNTDLDLVFLIDRSGSMHNAVDDTIGGFNSYIQKESEMNLTLLLQLFFLMISMKYSIKEKQ